MPKAFICGCSGSGAHAGRAVLPPGKRALGPHPLQAQRRRPRPASRADPIVSRMRRAAGRARADRSGRREGSAHGAAALARLSRRGRDRGGSAAGRGGDGGAADRAPDRRRSRRSRDHGRLRARARRRGAGDARRHRRPGAFSERPERVAAMGRAFADGASRRRVRRSSSTCRGTGGRGSDSHHELPVVEASRDELRRDFAPFAALRDLPMAMTRARRLQRARPGAAGDDVAARRPRHHARRDRFRRPDHERRRVDEGAAGLLRGAREPSSTPASISFSTATAISTRRARSPRSAGVVGRAAAPRRGGSGRARPGAGIRSRGRPGAAGLGHGEAGRLIAGRAPASGRPFGAEPPRAFRPWRALAQL